MRGVRRWRTLKSCCGSVMTLGKSLARSTNSRPQQYSSARALFSGPTRCLRPFDGGGELGVLAYGSAGELADAEAGAEGLFETDFDLVVVEDALMAGEVEGFEDLGYGDGAIFGDDSDGVAGGVGHALFDGQLYVAGLLLRAFAGEEAVVGHGGEEGVVAGVFGRMSGRLLFLSFHFGHPSIVKRIGSKMLCRLCSFEVFSWCFAGASW